MFSQNKKKLVIVGAGYGGISLLKNISKTNNFDITLINDKPIHLHQTDIHKYLNGEINNTSIAFDLEEYSKKRGINFICAKVDDINFNEKKVLFDNKELHYDYLTIATGSSSLFPRQIENISLHSKDIKEISNINFYRDEFDKLTKEKRKKKNIAIIGGGLSGVEIALEFAKKIKELNINKDELKVSLVEQFPSILPNTDERLIKQTTSVCDELGIERYHGNFVNKLDKDTIYLSNDSTIKFDLVIVNIGVTCNKLFSDESIKINPKNQIVVDKYLRIPQHNDVFVIGDIAETKDRNGKYTLPTAQIAKQHGKLTAKNLINTIKNKHLVENKLENKGVLIDLAGNSAVGIINNYKISGVNAFALKRFVSFLHRKSFA